MSTTNVNRREAPTWEASRGTQTSFGDLNYPSDLYSQEGRPIIQFRCNYEDSGVSNAYSIHLPIPVNISTSDGISYDDAELGSVGSIITEAASTALNGQGSFADNAKDVAKGIYDRGAGIGNGSIEGIIASVASVTPIAALTPEKVSSAVSIATQATVNPFVTTQFSGVATRGYTYTFKLMARSKAEADMIRSIDRAFRVGAYPEEENLALHYPPTWTVRYVQYPSFADISYIPKVFDCYLTSVSSAINASGNMWHKDGSPLETDISVTFKETRALTAKDILELS